jgi:hypothetical protein
MGDLVDGLNAGRIKVENAVIQIREVWCGNPDGPSVIKTAEDSPVGMAAAESFRRQLASHFRHCFSSRVFHESEKSRGCGSFGS